MNTYYDVLGVTRKATGQEIEQAWDATQLRLRHTGISEQFQDQMRKIRQTLLTPRLRAEYDRSLDFGNIVDTALLPPPPPGFLTQPLPPAESTPPPPLPEGGHRRFLWVGIWILAGLALLYGGWQVWVHRGATADQGIYLHDLRTQEKVAVILAKDPAHLFPGNTKSAPAVLVYEWKSQKVFWLGEALIELKYSEGEAAPEDLIQEGLAVAKEQDPHQSMR